MLRCGSVGLVGFVRALSLLLAAFRVDHLFELAEDVALTERGKAFDTLQGIARLGEAGLLIYCDHLRNLLTRTF